MSKNHPTPTPETGTADTESMQTGISSLSSDAMARRRMLLKSLGKGSSVIAAAAIPMHTLAATGTLANTASGKRCTISGTMSGVHSQNTVTAICEGYSPGYYKMISHWPNYNPTTTIATNTANGKTFTQNSTFTFLFGGTSTLGAQSLINIMLNYSSSDEFHWIPALLNSLAASPASNYPYSAKQIIDFYNSPEPARGNALNFFKQYMETHL